MNKLLVWLTSFCIALVGLHFLGVDLPLSTWIDGWGESASRGIRAALAAGGVALYVVSVAWSPRARDQTPRRR